ncbi:MAG TPA: DUF1365 domain-containing protein [Steroidobacteraceae bacterium]|nr:DUF1365 domain-containing protein [Steroidobacteraceae bacterium]
MHSCIYKGWVRHRRAAPVPHHFRYPLFMLYLDLAEIPALFDAVPGFSARRPALAWFRRRDYLAPHALPLDEALRQLVARRTGARPEGPIRLLTHLRYFGYCMNPVSFYYCFDRRERLESIVAEITNTPWKERHQYVLPVTRAGERVQRFEFDKDFHVSPFMPMDMRYRWSFSAPGPRLLVNMENYRGGEAMFDATLTLRAEPLTRAALLRTLAAFPMMTLQVIAAIHWQALRLWWKGTPFHAHPRSAALAQRP